jgi:hypothetical protein
MIFTDTVKRCKKSPNVIKQPQSAQGPESIPNYRRFRSPRPDMDHQLHVQSKYGI